MILNVDQIAFGYNGRRVLDDLSFSVDRGELLVILGPNGVGKTTLLRCINGILKPAEGAVMVEDRDVLKMGAMAVARRIGYVAQKQAAGRLTAYDAILMGRRPHVRFRVTEKDLYLVDGAVKTLHLEALAMRYSDPEVESVSTEVDERINQHMEAFIAQFEGKLRITDIRIAARMIKSCVEEIIRSITIFGQDEDSDRLIDGLADMIHRYLFD